MRSIKKTKIKLSRKFYLPLFAILITIIAVIGYSFIKDINPSQIKQETAVEEVKEIHVSDLNPKELEEYYAVYKNPHVLYLRKALDAYLANDSSDVNISMAAVEKDRRDGIITGLESFDKSYYESKFVVLTINDSIAGGKDIQILFQDKPDRIFYAWVYQLADGEYELRGWNSKEDIDKQALDAAIEFYGDLIFDKEHAL